MKLIILSILMSGFVSYTAIYNPFHPTEPSSRSEFIVISVETPPLLTDPDDDEDLDIRIRGSRKTDGKR